MTDLWRCTVCGQVSTVGRCCGEETREPWRPIKRKDEEETRRIEAVADRAEQLEAEIEALRAELAAWRELSDHVRVGACAAIWPDRYTDARTRDVAAALKRAARMEEALRKWWSAHRPVGWTEDQHRARPYVNLITVADKALTEALLRDQEARND